MSFTPQAIYNESRPIEEIIAHMQAYKSSSNSREQVRIGAALN